MDFIAQYLDSFFVSLTGCLVKGMALGHEIGENVFQLVDGRTCHIADVCSGSRLFVTLVAISILRLVSKPKDRLTWALLAATPLVVGMFNVTRCLIVAQRSMAVHDYAGFALFAIPVLFYAMHPERILRKRSVQVVGALLLSSICTWSATPAYANDNKPASVSVYVDEYVIDNGSYATTNGYFVARWNLRAGVNPMSTLHIACRPKGDESAEWEDLTSCSASLFETEVYIGDGENEALTLDYFMYTDYVPPAPVHTNGVYMFFVEIPKNAESNRYITIQSEVRKNGVKIMPPPRDEEEY